MSRLLEILILRYKFGRLNQSFADFLETVVGAIFVDTNYDLESTRTILMSPLLSSILSIRPEDIVYNPIRECQEAWQAKRMNVYKFWEKLKNGMTVAKSILVYSAAAFDTIHYVRSQPKSSKDAVLLDMAEELLPHVEVKLLLLLFQKACYCAS